MKNLFAGSFRRRLFLAFLIVSLVPLLICSAMLLQIFRLRMSSLSAESAQEHLAATGQAIDEIYTGFLHTANALRHNDAISRALTGGAVSDTYVYSELFSAVSEMRDYARFDLYDSGGTLHYSTQAAPTQERLPTSWGVLRAARDSQVLTFVATGDTSDTDSALLQAVSVLSDREGKPVGFLLISMNQGHLRGLFEGKFGAQNCLLLLSEFWRPVYCSQPAITQSLAEALRDRLLSGQSLAAANDDFIYTAAQHGETGLYMVLRQPQVLTRSSVSLLYTVSILSAIICIFISIIMSLQLSRQMFAPIALLHRAIDAVEQNNLNVYVSHHRRDELGNLARRFNEMLDALNRNQEALVENQRQLNTTQIQMMQAQLNPHFLCNTLDTMKWISKINKVPQVALMSTNLADILRFCISPVELVTLKAEAEILSRYMEIQSIRLSGSFAFEMEIPKELEDALVPKMILQPLVENAILHGIEALERGIIQVRAEKLEGELLQISVRDNGRGLPEEMQGDYRNRDRELSRGHLGLYNVDTILQKYYGEGFGLHLENNSGADGATVTARLPIRREEGAKC